MLNYRECWSSVAGKGGQRIPVGCVMLATIDLQFGPFSFQFKWFFHIRPGTCKLNLSFAVRAKIIISSPQNSLEAQVLQTLLFFLPQCAKCSEVLGERFLQESKGVLSLVPWTWWWEDAFREDMWDGPFTVRKAVTLEASLWPPLPTPEKAVGAFSSSSTKACSGLL